MLNMLVSCGGFEFDPILPGITSLIVTALKVLIPLALILLGMLDLGKAVMANDEKVMKEAQGKLIKRFIYAVLVFLVVALVQLVFGMLGKAGEGSETSTENTGITTCIDCFINNNCQ